MIHLPEIPRSATKPTTPNKSNIYGINRHDLHSPYVESVDWVENALKRRDFSHPKYPQPKSIHTKPVTPDQYQRLSTPTRVKPKPLSPDEKQIHIQRWPENKLLVTERLSKLRQTPRSDRYEPDEDHISTSYDEETMLNMLYQQLTPKDMAKIDFVRFQLESTLKAHEDQVIKAHQVPLSHLDSQVLANFSQLEVSSSRQMYVPQATPTIYENQPLSIPSARQATSQSPQSGSDPNSPNTNYSMIRMTPLELRKMKLDPSSVTANHMLPHNTAVNTNHNTANQTYTTNTTHNVNSHFSPMHNVAHMHATHNESPQANRNLHDTFDSVAHSHHIDNHPHKESKPLHEINTNMTALRPHPPKEAPRSNHHINKQRDPETLKPSETNHEQVTNKPDSASNQSDKDPAEAASTNEPSPHKQLPHPLFGKPNGLFQSADFHNALKQTNLKKIKPIPENTSEEEQQRQAEEEKQLKIQQLQQKKEKEIVCRQQYQRFVELMDKSQIPLIVSPTFISRVLLGRGKFASVYSAKFDLFRHSEIDSKLFNPPNPLSPSYTSGYVDVALKIANYHKNELSSDNNTCMSACLETINAPPVAILQEFEREIIALKALVEHPRIVHMVGYISQPFGLVMNLIKGENLYEFIRNIPEKHTSWLLDFNWRPDVLVDITDALSYMHTKHFLHRDIKSHNILIEYNMTSMEIHGVITDLGSAICLWDEDQQCDVSCVEAIGTSGYTAPEVLQPSESGYSYPADIFSLGTIFWEALIEDPKLIVNPWQGMDPMVLYEQMRSGLMPPRLPAYHNDTMDRLIRSMWAFEPKQRPQPTDILLHLSHYS